MKKLLFLLPLLALSANAEHLHLTCVDYDVDVTIGDDQAILVINGGSALEQKITEDIANGTVILPKTSDSLYQNESISFRINGTDRMLINRSDNFGHPCVDKFISPDCDNVRETVSLVCRMGETYNVTAKVCDDKAVLTINEKQSVLVKNDFFPKADASYLSGDFNIGFVVNHNEPENWPGYGKYILKVNGNQYPLCEEI